MRTPRAEASSLDPNPASVPPSAWMRQHGDLALDFCIDPTVSSERVST